MAESWVEIEQSPRERRTWRHVIAVVIVLVIMVAAAIDLAQPAWLLVGLIGPAALAGDEVARRHRRRAGRSVELQSRGGPSPKAPVMKPPVPPVMP
ncbi:MAG: hypothetical protein M3Y91_01350 [Actinomycetota bacterium]|nr:hypothetical protein [Actinomycetota bacterium]